MPTTQRSGKIIKEFRKLHKISQEELAEKAGISFRTLLRIEKYPEYNPSSEVIRAIARALNVSQAYLLGETDNPKANVVEAVHAFRIAVETEPLTTDQKLDKILAVLEDISRKLDK